MLVNETLTNNHTANKCICKLTFKLKSFKWQRNELNFGSIGERDNNRRAASVLCFDLEHSQIRFRFDERHLDGTGDELSSNVKRTASNFPNMNSQTSELVYIQSDLKSVLDKLTKAGRASPTKFGSFVWKTTTKSCRLINLTGFLFAKL